MAGHMGAGFAVGTFGAERQTCTALVEWTCTPSGSDGGWCSLGTLKSNMHSLRRRRKQPSCDSSPHNAVGFQRELSPSCPGLRATRLKFLLICVLMLDAAMFHDGSVEIECPKCGHKTECEIARLKSNQDFVCRSCDKRFHINAAGLASDRDTAGESADYVLRRRTV